MAKYVQEWKCSNCGLTITKWVGEIPSEDGYDGCRKNTYTGKHAWYAVGNPKPYGF